jgi:quercetin dioxygenase-like cupin family protein
MSIEPTNLTAYPPTRMDFEELKTEALRALDEGGSGDWRMHDDRAVAVKTTPLKGNGSAMAVGVSALPPGYRTPPHSHAAEEVAVVISGSGGIEIGDEVFEVAEGTVLVTPSNSTHSTYSDSSSSLVILWVYAPPGSEERWLADRATAVDPRRQQQSRSA